jgi:hypothetical protein
MHRKKIICEDFSEKKIGVEEPNGLPGLGENI